MLRSVMLLNGICFVAICSECQSNTTLTDVRTAWLRRQRATTNLDVSWEQVRQVPHRPGGNMPTSRTMTSRFVFENGMYRFENDGPQRRGTEKGIFYVDTDYVSTFNSSDCKSFFGVHVDDDEHLFPVGFVSAESNFPEFGNVNLIPLLMFYRGCTSELVPFDMNASVIAANVVVAHKHKCYRLIPKDHARTEVEVIVDPRCEYAPISITRKENRVPLYTVEMGYASSADGALVPTSWTIETFRPLDETLLHVTTAVVKAHSVNVEIPPGTFAFHFPEGTVVRDLKEDSKYLVRGNHDKREILDDETARGATYRELLESESGMARADHRFARWEYLIWYCGGLMALSLVCVLAIRRRMKR